MVSEEDRRRQLQTEQERISRTIALRQEQIKALERRDQQLRRPQDRGARVNNQVLLKNAQTNLQQLLSQRSLRARELNRLRVGFGVEAARTGALQSQTKKRTKKVTTFIRTAEDIKRIKRRRQAARATKSRRQRVKDKVKERPAFLEKKADDEFKQAEAKRLEAELNPRARKPGSRPEPKPLFPNLDRFRQLGIGKTKDSFATRFVNAIEKSDAESAKKFQALEDSARLASKDRKERFLEFLQKNIKNLPPGVAPTVRAAPDPIKFIQDLLIGQAALAEQGTAIPLKVTASAFAAAESIKKGQGKHVLREIGKQHRDSSRAAVGAAKDAFKNPETYVFALVGRPSFKQLKAAIVKFKPSVVAASRLPKTRSSSKNAIFVNEKSGNFTYASPSGKVIGGGKIKDLPAVQRRKVATAIKKASKPVTKKQREERTFDRAFRKNTDIVIKEIAAKKKDAARLKRDLKNQGFTSKKQFDKWQKAYEGTLRGNAKAAKRFRRMEASRLLRKKALRRERGRKISQGRQAGPVATKKRLKEARKDFRSRAILRGIKLIINRIKRIGKPDKKRQKLRENGFADQQQFELYNKVFDDALQGVTGARTRLLRLERWRKARLKRFQALDKKVNDIKKLAAGFRARVARFKKLKRTNEAAKKEGFASEKERVRYTQLFEKANQGDKKALASIRAIETKRAARLKKLKAKEAKATAKKRAQAKKARSKAGAKAVARATKIVVKTKPRRKLSKFRAKQKREGKLNQSKKKKKTVKRKTIPILPPLKKKATRKTTTSKAGPDQSAVSVVKTQTPAKSKTKTRSRSRARTTVRPKPKTVTGVKPTQRQKFSQTSAARSSSGQKLELKQPVGEKIRSRTRAKPKQRQSQKRKLRLLPFQRLKVETVKKPPRKPKKPKKPKTPKPRIKPPGLPGRRPPPTTTKKQQGYNVFVRTRGKSEKANVLRLTKAQASKLGRSITDRSTAASFVIRKARGSAVKNLVPIKQAAKSKFRLAKKKSTLPSGSRVEKRGRRIDTRGEKAGLKSSQLISQRRKAVRAARKRKPFKSKIRRSKRK